MLRARKLPPIFPAWCISLSLHLVLLVALAWLLGTSPRGTSLERVRSVGIVLQDAAEDAGQDEEASGEAATSAVESPPAPAPVASPPDQGAPPEQSPRPRAAAAGRCGLDSRDAVRGEPAPLGAGGGAGGRGLARLAQLAGQARVEVFGVVGVGSHFVYAFDRSVSMEGAPLAAAKRQLVASLESLNDVHQFQIIFFNHRLTMFDISGGGRVAFASEENRQRAAQFVRGISADGGTDRLAALKQAIRLGPDVVFFLTDADDPMPPGETAEVARLNRRGATAINTIEFGRGPPHRRPNFLVRLAEESGGQYGYVDADGLRAGTPQR